MAWGGKKIPPGLTNWFCSSLCFIISSVLGVYFVLIMVFVYLLSVITVTGEVLLYKQTWMCECTQNLFFNSPKSLLCCYVYHRILPPSNNSGYFLIALSNCIQSIEMRSNFICLFQQWPFLEGWHPRILLCFSSVCWWQSWMESLWIQIRLASLHEGEKSSRTLTIGPGGKGDQKDW